MNTMQLRGNWNQLRGGMLICWSRLKGDRRGRINGRLLKAFGGAQMRLGRCRSTFGRMISR